MNRAFPASAPRRSILLMLSALCFIPIGNSRAEKAPATKPSVAVVPAGKEIKLAIGGLIQGQGEFGDAADPRFVGIKDRLYLRRARVVLTGGFAEHFDFKIEGDFGANSLSAGTGLRAQANEVYVNWNRYPQANLRFGQLKPAFGAEQLTNDAVLWTIERSLGSDRLTDGRQPSFGVLGSFFDKRLSYLVTVGNGSGINSSANDNDAFLTAARVYGTAVDSPAIGRLVLGASFMRSDDDGVTKTGFDFDSVAGGAVDNLFFGERRGWGVDAEWRFARLRVAAELLRTQYEPLNALPAAKLDASGYQLTAACFLLPDKLQAVLRREVLDQNRDLSGGVTRNWVAGLTYSIKGDDIRLLVNYLFGDSPGLPNDSGRLLTRIQLVF